MSAYYPASPDKSGAAVVNVGAGSEIQGIEIRLSPVETYAIAGHLALPSGTDPATTFVGVLLQAENGEASRGGFAQVRDGTFRFENIEPGSYRLSPPPFGRDIFQGKATVEVAKQSVSGVKLAFYPSISLEATVEYEDGEAPGPSGARWPPFGITSDNPGRQYSRPFVIRDDGGKWVIDKITPDQYHVVDVGAYYVTRVRVGGRTVEGNRIAIAEGETGPLVVTLGRKMATLTATVEGVDAKDLPAILIRCKQRDVPFRTRISTVDVNGRFETTLPPGEYHVVAAQGLSIESTSRPAVLDAIAALGEKVVAEPGKTSTVHFKTISREALQSRMNEN